MLQLDPAAQVRTVIVTDIAAPRERVWAVLTDISQWPDWMEMITAAQLQGGLARGGESHWSIAGAAIRSTLREVIPACRLAWTGSDGTHEGIHIWELQPNGTETRLSNAESITGAADPIAHQKALEAALSLWNLSLKARAESGAP